MKKKRKFCYLILVFILLINTVIVYADDEMEQLQEQLEQKNQELKELVNEKNQKSKEYKNIVNEINKLDTQIDKIDNELQGLESEITQINENIETTKLELSQAEENILNKNETINKRLRVMYKNGTVGYLEVLLAAEDLSDFFTRLDMVQRIVDKDVELLKYMKEQRDIIEEKKEKMENQKEMMVAVKLNVEKKKNELEIVSRQRDSRMKILQKDLKLLDKQEDALLATANRLKNEMKKLELKREYEGGEMMWPAPGYYRITSPFGMRMHPILHRKKMHTGIDIGVPFGGKIVAANGGVVQYAGWLGGYGKVVWIDHGGGISTLYAHNSSLLVKKGDTVKKGKVISKAGSTGYSTGPHLHFEVRKNGEYVNPTPWVKGN